MNQLVTIQNNQPITTSRMVAKKFSKKHKNVLRDIKRMECSKEFTRLNFELSEYKDSTGRKLPEYHIRKDGFTFLVMGYAGRTAAKFKEEYINEFNRRQEEIEQLKLTDQQRISTFVRLWREMSSFAELGKATIGDPDEYHTIRKIKTRLGPLVDDLTMDEFTQKLIQHDILDSDGQPKIEWVMDRLVKYKSSVYSDRDEIRTDYEIFFSGYGMLEIARKLGLINSKGNSEMSISEYISVIKGESKFTLDDIDDSDLKLLKPWEHPTRIN